MIRYETNKIIRTNKYCYIFTILALFMILLSEKIQFENNIYIYLIKPAFYALTAVAIMMLPRKKSACKIRTKKSITWWTVYLAFAQIMMMLFIGFIEGFGKSPYDLTIKGILINLFMIFSFIAAKENIRAYLINGLKGSKLIIMAVFTIIIMALIDLPLYFIKDLKDIYIVIRYVGEHVLTNLSENIFSSYLVYLGGPNLSIIYFVILRAFEWLSPILPDLSWILKSIIGTLVPAFNLMIIQYIYLMEDKGKRKKIQRRDNPRLFIITNIICILIIWFVIGVFPIRPVAIATGSMMPYIKPGDIVIVKRYKNNELKVGQIIEYKKDDISIFHRIVEIKTNGNQINYVTKGDNNAALDAGLISDKDVRGAVIGVIPKIGWPSIIFRAKYNIQSESPKSNKK